MSRFAMIAASVALLGAMPAFAAPKAVTKAPFPMAADGTTNIADCAKVDAKFRNECISKSRPVSGKQVYADAAAYKAVAAKKEALAALKAGKDAKAASAAKAAAAKAAEKVAAAKVKAPVPVAVAGAPKGFKIGKDGTTNVADCAKAAPQVRNECISRARPMTGKELAKFIKSRAAATPVAAVKTAAKPVATTVVPKTVASKTAAAVKPAAVPVLGKGFTIAKDGTTNIADCAKANPNFRNECISRARPVPGKVIYASMKSKA